MLSFEPRGVSFASVDDLVFLSCVVRVALDWVALSCSNIALLLEVVLC